MRSGFSAAKEGRHEGSNLLDMRSRALVYGCIAALLLGALALPASARLPEMLLDLEEDCLQIPPEDTPPLALDTSEPLSLKVRVLIEEADRDLAKSYIRESIKAFSRIGIEMKVRLKPVVPPSEWPNGQLQGPGRDQIFEWMKSLFPGGVRPKNTDVVYYMTRYWAGGVADCIGGVRFADRAFAFGSIDYATEGVVPMPTVNEGHIAAHELGHLLGAHHHYATCGEATVRAAAETEAAACSTMFPLAAGISGFFGATEASFIRHYAREYAPSNQRP